MLQLIGSRLGEPGADAAAQRNFDQVVADHGSRQRGEQAVRQWKLDARPQGERLLPDVEAVGEQSELNGISIYVISKLQIINNCKTVQTIKK
jgi:hypothetical protein